MYLNVYKKKRKKRKENDFYSAIKHKPYFIWGFQSYYTLYLSYKHFFGEHILVKDCISPWIYNKRICRTSSPSNIWINGRMWEYHRQKKKNIKYETSLNIYTTSLNQVIYYSLIQVLYALFSTCFPFNVIFFIVSFFLLFCIAAPDKRVEEHIDKMSTHKNFSLIFLFITRFWDSRL